ncbi:MAG: tryptophan--tRNA ligase, partial [Nitrospinaceae bacterium]
MAKKRILSGMQPSGLLHLGNYYGALKNWIELQEQFECFYFVADWHSLTTLYEDPSHIKKYTFEVA